MKTYKMITLDVEIAEKLKKEANASGLVNFLLQKHYKTLGSYTNGAVEILHEVEEEELTEKEKEKNEAIAKYLENIHEPENAEKEREYREGLADGKWKSYSEFAERKLSEKEAEKILNENAI